MKSNHYDPSNWKWGIFYYNKEDKRIFPPKKYGFGWTTNFANPSSIAVFIVLLILFGILFQFVFGNVR